MQNDWWGQPLLPEILDQTDRVGAKSPIFYVCARSDTAVTPSEKSSINAIRKSTTLFTCHLFSHVRVHGSKKNFKPSSSDLSLINVLLWRALQQKCVVKTFETLIIRSMFCYNARSGKPGRNKRDVSQTDC